MAVPKRRTSKSKLKMRKRSHKRSLPAVSVDSQTGSVHQPHRVDPETGMYRGRQVLTVSSDD